MANGLMHFILWCRENKAVIPFLAKDSILRFFIKVLIRIIEQELRVIFELIGFISLRLKGKQMFISGSRLRLKTSRDGMKEFHL